MSQPLHIWRIVEVDGGFFKSKIGAVSDHDQAFNLVMLAQQYGSSRVLLDGTEYTIVGAARAIRDYFPKEGNHV